MDETFGVAGGQGRTTSEMSNTVAVLVMGAVLGLCAATVIGAWYGFVMLVKVLISP